ncbi:MAG: MCE family protein [Deltaproteobacteria bacterium]|nr:MCE family protein [Deltaproteobacteria bacterium]
MSAPTNHWKLGAFVVVTLLAGVAVGTALTSRSLQTVTVTYQSYFDEAVTGLEVGSPVSFRGVKIGSVSAIEVAPDRRHVELSYDLGVSVLQRLGLVGTSKGKATRLSVPPDLRVQIASTGLTGTKYLQIDFFDTRGEPPPALPFPEPRNYIPAIPSTMKNLEEAVVRAIDQLPGLVRDLGVVVTRAGALLDEVDRRGLAPKAAATLDGATRTLAQLDHVLARVDADGGLLESVQQTSDSLGDLGGPRLAANLDETGRDLREVAVAVRRLVEALERDPEMLLKGRAKAQVRR